MTAPTPEPPREPQLLQACGGLPVPELGAAVPRPGWPPWGRPLAAWPLPGGHRDLPRAAAKLQVHSLLPSPDPGGSRSRPRSGPVSAQGCSAQKLAAPKGPCGLGTECEAAALRLEIPAVSELAAVAALNSANEISPGPHPFRPAFSPCSQGVSRGVRYGESGSGREQSRLCLRRLLDYRDVRPGRTRPLQRQPESEAEESSQTPALGKIVQSYTLWQQEMPRFSFLFN